MNGFQAADKQKGDKKTPRRQEMEEMEKKCVETKGGLFGEKQAMKNNRCVTLSECYRTHLAERLSPLQVVFVAIGIGFGYARNDAWSWAGAGVGARVI